MHPAEGFLNPSAMRQKVTNQAPGRLMAGSIVLTGLGSTPAGQASSPAAGSTSIASSTGLLQGVPSKVVVDQTLECQEDLECPEASAGAGERQITAAPCAASQQRIGKLQPGMTWSSRPPIPRHSSESSTATACATTNPTPCSTARHCISPGYSFASPAYVTMPGAPGTGVHLQQVLPQMPLPSIMHQGGLASLASAQSADSSATIFKAFQHAISRAASGSIDSCEYAAAGYAPGAFAAVQAAAVAAKPLDSSAAAKVKHPGGRGRRKDAAFAAACPIPEDEYAAFVAAVPCPVGMDDQMEQQQQQDSLYAALGMLSAACLEADMPNALAADHSSSSAACRRAAEAMLEAAAAAALSLEKADVPDVSACGALLHDQHDKGSSGGVLNMKPGCAASKPRLFQQQQQHHRDQQPDECNQFGTDTATDNAAAATAAADLDEHVHDDAWLLQEAAHQLLLLQSAPGQQQQQQSAPGQQQQHMDEDSEDERNHVAPLHQVRIVQRQPQQQAQHSQQQQQRGRKGPGSKRRASASGKKVPVWKSFMERFPTPNPPAVDDAAAAAAAPVDVAVLPLLSQRSRSNSAVMLHQQSLSGAASMEVDEITARQADAGEPAAAAAWEQATGGSATQLAPMAVDLLAITPQDSDAGVTAAVTALVSVNPAAAPAAASTPAAAPVDITAVVPPRRRPRKPQQRHNHHEQQQQHEEQQQQQQQHDQGILEEADQQRRSKRVRRSSLPAIYVRYDAPVNVSPTAAANGSLEATAGAAAKGDNAAGVGSSSASAAAVQQLEQQQQQLQDTGTTAPAAGNVAELHDADVTPRQGLAWGEQQHRQSKPPGCVLDLRRHSTNINSDKHLHLCVDQADKAAAAAAGGSDVCSSLDGSVAERPTRARRASSSSSDGGPRDSSKVLVAEPVQARLQHAVSLFMCENTATAAVEADVWPGAAAVTVKSEETAAAAGEVEAADGVGSRAGSKTLQAAPAAADTFAVNTEHSKHEAKEQHDVSALAARVTRSSSRGATAPPQHHHHQQQQQQPSVQQQSGAAAKHHEQHRQTTSPSPDDSWDGSEVQQLLPRDVPMAKLQSFSAVAKVKEAAKCSNGEAVHDLKDSDAADLDMHDSSAACNSSASPELDDSPTAAAAAADSGQNCGRPVRNCRNKGGRPKGSGNRTQMAPRNFDKTGRPGFALRSAQYTGVYQSKRAHDGWRTQFSYNNKVLNLGTYETEDDAARAWNAAALYFRGEGTWLNPVQPPLPADFQPGVLGSGVPAGTAQVAARHRGK